MARTTPRSFATIAAGLALLAGLKPSAAQTPQPPADPSQAEISVHESGFTIRTRVNLVSVPVVVRDSQGRAVGDLSREVFQISDNGKPQPISKFSVEKFGESAAEVVEAETLSAPKEPARAEPARPRMPGRFVAFFFDDLNTEFSDLANARAAAWRYMQKSMRPSERVAIATASGLNTLDFTNDPDKLSKVLLAIHPQEGIVNGNDCPPMSVYQANLIVNFNDSLALGAAVADYRACTTVVRPPSEAAYSVFNFARMHVNFADRYIRRALDVLDGLLRKMNTMAGQRVIVMASSGFQMLDERRQDELGILERAIRSGVVVNTLDARGLYTSIPGGDASRPNTSDAAWLELKGFANGAATAYSSVTTSSSGAASSGSGTAIVRDGYAREESLAKRATLAEVASATGGHFFENSNDLDAGFARLAAAPEYLYVLGFSPQDLKSDGKFHSIRVTLKDPHELTVEARKGYYAPRSTSDPDQRSAHGIEEAVFSRDEVNDIPVIVQTQFSKPSPDRVNLSIAAKVDLGKVSLRKEQGRNRGSVTVVTGVFDSDGNYVSGIQKVFDLRLRDETVRAYPGLTVRNTFDVTPGAYLVRLVVCDVEGQVMASKTTRVEIP